MRAHNGVFCVLFRIVEKRPEGQTTFVVVGSEVAPTKLEFMKNKGLKTISEKELLLLVKYRGAEEMDKPIKEVTTKGTDSTPAKKKAESKPTQSKATPAKRSAGKDTRGSFE